MTQKRNDQNIQFGGDHQKNYTPKKKQKIIEIQNFEPPKWSWSKSRPLSLKSLVSDKNRAGSGDKLFNTPDDGKIYFENSFGKLACNINQRAKTVDVFFLYLVSQIVAISWMSVNIAVCVSKSIWPCAVAASYAFLSVSQSAVQNIIMKWHILDLLHKRLSITRILINQSTYVNDEIKGLTNFSTNYFMMCKVYIDVGGIN